ncbi:unnamed protein product [Citrullus colocynthis]|uniref:Uncharacterized protein n=1 Tax=Citrullus colocynthis TaxID=252529 RepID=A0ABP0YBY1_9ROSI
MHLGYLPIPSLGKTRGKLQQESRFAWPRRSEISLPQFPRLEFVENNLEDLKELWENLALEPRTEFARAYENIADLMYANISTQALQALQFTPFVQGLEDWDFSYESDEKSAKVCEAVEAWKFVRSMKSLRHCEGTTEQYDNWRAARVGIEIAQESTNPSMEIFWKNENHEKDLERLKQMNQVLATENEELRAEVRRLVQQATSAQRQLEEATRCLQRQPELEKERDSLNIEAIHMKKKNKRLLRDVDVLHNEVETQRSTSKSYNKSWRE